MPLSNRQYDEILRSYEEKQLRNRHILGKRTEEVYATIPQYRALEDSVSSFSIAQGKKLIDGDTSALTDLKTFIRNISQQKEEELINAGFPADYLTLVCDCKDCADTGYVEGKKCHCFQQKIIYLLYSQSNIQELLKTENFQLLSFEYYKENDLSLFQNTVSTCKEFIKNFKSDYHNLFFYGTVGTGKSFLSNCVAKELIELGQSVIYFSAAGLFDLLSQQTFRSTNKDDLMRLYDDLYNCDLVIIDDLGTELTTSFVSSQLFSCINERHLRKKSTIISTNLSLESLRERYSDRIFSRITSNYSLCKFTGPDIRMYKKRMMNRK